MLKEVWIETNVPNGFPCNTQTPIGLLSELVSGGIRMSLSLQQITHEQEQWLRNMKMAPASSLPDTDEIDNSWELRDDCTMRIVQVPM